MPSHPAPSAGTATSASRLCSAALAARWLGALASLALTLYAGRHNHSIVLPVLFAGWVLLPYCGLIAAGRLASRTPPGIAGAIHAAALLLAAVPPVIYAVVSILAPGHPATFAFLTVPAASWLAIATLFIATRLSKRS